MSLYYIVPAKWDESSIFWLVDCHRGGCGNDQRTPLGQSKGNESGRKKKPEIHWEWKEARVVEQERSEQKLGYMERREYLWDKLVVLLSAAKTAEQGDLDWGNWWLQVWEITKCRKSRTRGQRWEDGTWNMSHPQGGWKHATAVREILAEVWVENMSAEPLGSCGAVRIMQSDETLKGTGFSFLNFFTWFKWI